MKKLIIFILSLSLLTSIPVTVFAEKQADTEIKAKSSILMCMDTKDVIKENNSYEHLSPASVTKIMTILLIMEAIDSGHISLDDMVTASENAVSKGGSQIWLEVGEQMSVNDLLKAVIIASANDACTALGEYVAGSDSAFVDNMNERAEQLGLSNTHFENCTGLDDSVTNHYSCAYDLAVIACEVMKHDLVKEYSTVWLDSLRNGKTELNNTNKLVNKYNGITGLKTGTTSNAGFCLCATATRDGMNLVSVVLGADTSEDRFNLTTNLLDYGFANYSLNFIKLDKSKITPVKIKNGIVKSVTPIPPESKSILVKKGTKDFTYEYKIEKEVQAPVKAGQILGEITVKCEDKEIASVPLKAENDVKKTTFLYIFEVLFSNI
ncbi:MAG: D-alanyl-D-alanine carboxypeptidase [Eubacteriales bacterium]|nr:D-alanyl-D-alanine carboxypeptidase [Eubacteriales bacterium]